MLVDLSRLLTESEWKILRQLLDNEASELYQQAQLSSGYTALVLRERAAELRSLSRMFEPYEIEANNKGK